MVIYIIEPDVKMCGANRWSNLQDGAIKINDCNELLTYDITENDVLYVNNYQRNIDFNKIKIKIYYVMHSDLCPVNYMFVDNKQHYHGIVCTNKMTYDKCNKLFVDKEIIYLPNTFKLKSMLSYTPEKNKDTIYLHFVGRLSPEKNIVMLLDVMKIFKLSGISNIKLKIFGRAPHVGLNRKYYEYLVHIANKHNINELISFEGMAGMYDKFELYKNADLVVLPSIHEGLPYCLLEANAYGLEFVSNDVSDIKYHIPSENGFTFKFNGLNTKKYQNNVYVNTYDTLLLQIGYIKCPLVTNLENTITDIKYLSKISIKQNSDMNDDCSYKLKDKYKIQFRKHAVIPPYLIDKNSVFYLKNEKKIKEKSMLYFSNVHLLKNAILAKLNFDVGLRLTKTI